MATAGTASERVRPQTAGADPSAVDPGVIGARVRALREASALSLRELSGRSGVSAPMLSQVERGETSPTLTVAARIAAGLDLTLSQLLRLDEGGTVTIVRAGKRRRGGSPRRPPPPRGAAAGPPDAPPMHEPGSRETALVESGSVVLVCDGEHHELAEG